MAIVEHSELVQRALQYVYEQRILRPDASLMTLIDEAAMRCNLTPLDSQHLTRVLSPETLKKEN